MNMLLVSAIIFIAGIAGIVGTSAWSQAPNLRFETYYTTPLENDPSRYVLMMSTTMPPKQENRFHRHPGDQWTAVQEGEVTLMIQGQEPKTLKAGDSFHIPRGTILQTMISKRVEAGEAVDVRMMYDGLCKQLEEIRAENYPGV